MGLKKEVISLLFQQFENERFDKFDNTRVRQVSEQVGFKNHFDATKIDRRELLPQELIANDYFIHHIGQGEHQFVKGIDYAYHTFEDISLDNYVTKNYKPSILNEINSSESNILSLINNQKILHTFLYGSEDVHPNIYNAHRTKASLEYNIGNLPVKLDRVQIEIDMTCELNGEVTVFEAKSNLTGNFAVYQIFHPFLYYQLLNQEKKLGIKKVNCCYVLKKSYPSYTTVRMYLYTFTDNTQISSLKLIKSVEYKLCKE